MTALTERKPKIVYVINDENFFFSHRASLVIDVQKIYDVHIVLPTSIRRNEIEKMGVKVYDLPLSRKGLNPLLDAQTTMSLYLLFRKIRPDIVHNFTIKPAIYSSLAARWAGVSKIFTTITGMGFVFTENTLSRLALQKLVLWLYSRAFDTDKVKVIFQNSEDQSIFLSETSLDKARAFLVPGSGVRKDKFAVTPEPSSPPFRIVVPCRMLWDKGVGDVAAAARILNTTHPGRFEFILAGRLDPSNPSAIEETQLRHWESDGLVKWLNHVEDMNALFQSCHIVCLPSYREGIPLALLEAALCKRAIITTDVPGCRDLIKDKVNGVLVPHKNATRLAQGILELANNPELRHQVSEEAREETLQKYTTEVINTQIMEIYRTSHATI